MDIIYSANEKPPITTQIFLGLQHCMSMASTLVLVIILLNAAHSSLNDKAHFLAASIFAIGLGSLLMGLKSRFIGTGYLCPLLCEPAFLIVSLLAVHQGGLGLLFGMTCLAGLFQILTASVYTYIRKLFPIEVTGVVVLMVGISLIIPDLVYSTGVDSLNTIHLIIPNIITAGAALIVMVILVVWGRGVLMRYCLLFGILTGFIVAKYLNIFTPANTADFMAAPHYAWPLKLTFNQMHINPNLIFVFFIASIAATLKGIGGLIQCQKINDITWVRPDTINLRKGIFTNGISTLLGSLIGCMGLGVSNNNVGISIATKVTSRYVGIFAGILFMIFAFIPKISMIFVIMPKPILGAMLLFVTSYVLINGLQLITARLLDTRKIFVVGFSLITGLAVLIAPKLVDLFPPIFQTLAGAPIVLTTIVAICLSLILRIGIAKEVTLDITSFQNCGQEIKLFLEANGRIWGATSDAIELSIMSCIETLEALYTLNVSPPIKLNFKYDAYSLVTKIYYTGKELALQSKLPSKEDFKKSDTGIEALAVNLLREYTPHTQIKADPATPNGYIITLRFVE